MWLKGVSPNQTKVVLTILIQLCFEVSGMLSVGYILDRGMMPVV